MLKVHVMNKKKTLCVFFLQYVSVSAVIKARMNSKKTQWLRGLYSVQQGTKPALKCRYMWALHLWRALGMFSQN